MIVLPRLYAIVDSSNIASSEGAIPFAKELAAAGCLVLQYRNKSGKARAMLDQARDLKRYLGSSVRLIMNDRADLCLAASSTGCMSGRRICRRNRFAGSLGRIAGWGFRRTIPSSCARRIRLRPTIWPLDPCSRRPAKTSLILWWASKGCAGRGALTRKPLVAIGGITRANAASVIEAGADSVAVISDLLREPRKSAEEFFRILR